MKKFLLILYVCNVFASNLYTEFNDDDNDEYFDFISFNCPDNLYLMDHVQELVFPFRNNIHYIYRDMFTFACDNICLDDE